MYWDAWGSGSLSHLLPNNRFSNIYWNLARLCGSERGTHSQFENLGGTAIMLYQTWEQSIVTCDLCCKNVARHVCARADIHVWASDIQLLQHGCAKLCDRLYLHRRIVNLGSGCAQVPVLQDVHRSSPRSPCHPLRPGTGSGTALVPCWSPACPEEKAKTNLDRVGRLGFSDHANIHVNWCALLCIHVCDRLYLICVSAMLSVCQFEYSIVMYRQRNTLGNTR